MGEVGDETGRQQIVDTAIRLAEQGSWESVRLHDVAKAMGIDLDAIHRHFREKDELIDAWFDRADETMLRRAADPAAEHLPPGRRLHELMMAWLDALEPHRGVTRQMIGAKLEPGHVHIQFPAVMRISRTVQWMREGARLRDSGVERALTEIGCTAIYLAGFAHWMSEDTPGSPRTRRLLDDGLRRAEDLMRLWPFAHGADRRRPASTP
jgi:ubiquinone biosynthesis protein COQ9